MLTLIVGLVLFLGVHSVRMLAPAWRESFIEKHGQAIYKGIYSATSFAGLVFLILGYGQTRAASPLIWSPPTAMAHIAALLMLIAFVLLASAYVPGNRLKAAVGHPMVLGIKVWAFAHLLANGQLGDMVLFGAFLVWAIINFVKSRKADRQQGVVRTSDNNIARDSITVVAGVAAWLVFAMWGHQWLIGVSPFSA